MFVLRPICRAEASHEFRHEFVLSLLREHDSQQFQSRWRHSLAGVMDKTRVSCETQIVITTSQVIQRAVIDALPVQRVDRLRLVPFCL